MLTREHWKNLQNIKNIIDIDKRYMDKLYKYEPDVFNKWAMWIKTNLANLLKTYNIPSGKIVQVGTWNGDFYFELQKIFGTERCIGFDIAQYIDDPSIIYGDFREIKNNYSIPCALFYNGLGSWKHNVESKTAGLLWAKENLVSGGLYLDVIHKDLNILKDIEGLQYCNTYDDRLIVLKKS